MISVVVLEFAQEGVQLLDRCRCGGFFLLLMLQQDSHLHVPFANSAFRGGEFAFEALRLFLLVLELLLQSLHFLLPLAVEFFVLPALCL